MTSLFAAFRHDSLKTARHQPEAHQAAFMLTFVYPKVSKYLRLWPKGATFKLTTFVGHPCTCASTSTSFAPHRALGR